MEAEAGQRCPHAELREVQAGALEVSWGELDPFREQHQGAGHEEGQHGDDGEEVYVVHGFLLLLAAEEPLAEDVPCLVEQIRRHGAPEPDPVERNLGQRCQGDAADDRHQGAQHQQRRRLAEEEGGEQDGEEGLGGLDGVREGDSHLAQAHVGEHRAQHVPRRGGGAMVFSRRPAAAEQEAPAAWREEAAAAQAAAREDESEAAARCI